MTIIMMNSNLYVTLNAIKSFEAYEQLKQNSSVFGNLAERLASEIINLHQLPKNSLTLFSEGTNIVISYGDTKVIKIYPPFHEDQFNSELLVLKHLQGKLSIRTPSVEYEGNIAGWPYIIMTKLEGELLETLWEKMAYENKIVIIKELGSLIREVHAVSPDGLESIDSHWPLFINQQINNCVAQHKSNNLPENLLRQIPAYLEDITNSLMDIKTPVILTGEYTPMNLLVKRKEDMWHITGLIDFGDAMLGLPEYDLLGPAVFLIQGDKQLLKEFLISYGYTQTILTEKLSHQLTALMLLHKYSNLNIQIRIKDWQRLVSSLEDLQQLVWGFFN